ncbi:hypothetical protein Taro_023249, partial [Colocasia esculenta]|nr:hypothetical protein [Colocasia esculenta]
RATAVAATVATAAAVFAPAPASRHGAVVESDVPGSLTVPAVPTVPTVPSILVVPADAGRRSAVRRDCSRGLATTDPAGSTSSARGTPSGTTADSSCSGSTRGPHGASGETGQRVGSMSSSTPSRPWTVQSWIRSDSEDSDVDDVLSKLQKILKKKKNGSRRIRKKEKKEKEPVCYECRKPGHLIPDCPRIKKTGQAEKSKKQHKKFKTKAMVAAWENGETTSSESSSSESEKEQDQNLKT